MLNRSFGRAARGFTLIELLFTMVIAGILAAVALPGLQHQIHRVRRSDVLVAAVQVQQAEERYRSGATSYGDLAQVGVPALSSQGHYRLEIVHADADGYELLATAVGAQARDTGCRYLKLSASGLNVQQASGPDERVGNPSTQNRQCWGLR